MSRDRFGEFSQATRNQDVEMGHIGPFETAFEAGNSEQDAFWRQTETIDKMIADMKSNIAELEKTYKHSLASYEEVHRDSTEIDRLIDATNRLSASIRSSLKDLETSSRNPPDRVKANRVLALSRRFRDTISEYRNTQSTYDKKMRDQIGRQYRIVRPEATQDEVDRAVAEPSGGIFRQELLSSRTNRANAVLTEVEDRHRNIQNIVKSINELNQLFAELSDMVASQGQMIDSIEQQTDDAVVNTQKGNVQLDKGIKSARSWRKGKWICLIISIIIVIVVVIIVLWQLGVFKQIPSSSSSSSTSTPTSAPPSTVTVTSSVPELSSTPADSLTPTPTS